MAWQDKVIEHFSKELSPPERIEKILEEIKKLVEEAEHVAEVNNIDLSIVTSIFSMQKIQDQTGLYSCECWQHSEIC